MAGVSLVSDLGNYLICKTKVVNYVLVRALKRYFWG